MKRQVILCCLLIFAGRAVRAEEGGNLPPLEQAAKEQQRSISKLVYALKEVRKVIPPPGQAQQPQPKKDDPFEDKQEYKHEPPEQKLQQLAKQQQDIIDQLKPQSNQSGQQAPEESQPQPGSPSGAPSDQESPSSQPGAQPVDQDNPAGSQGTSPQELAAKQQGISDELKKLADNPGLDSTVRKAVKEAKTASDQAAEAMKAEAGTEAQVGAQKTLAKIKEAMGEQGKNAQKNADEALDKAAQELAEAEELRQDDQGTKAAKKAEEAQQTLENAAQQQKQAGSGPKAKMLEDLARQIRDGDLATALADAPRDPATAQQLEKVREAIAKARQGDRTARDELEQASQELENLQQEMQYRKKHPEDTTDAQMDALLKESSVLAQRIARAQKQMNEQAQNPNEPSKKPNPNPSECQGDTPGEGNTPSQGTTPSQSQSETQGDFGQGAANSSNGRYSGVHDIEVLRRRWTKPQTIIPPREIILKELIGLTDQILVQARQTLDALEKETVVHTVSKEEVPEKYRDDVSTYFETLSNPDDE